MSELRISTWNCNSSPSIKTEEKASQAFQTKCNILNELNADISVFQEIARPSQIKTSTVVWNGDSLGHITLTIVLFRKNGKLKMLKSEHIQTG